MLKFVSLRRFCFDQYSSRPLRQFMVRYSFVEDMHYKRIPYREAHNALIEKYEKQGSVVIGGSFFPIEGALLVFEAKDELVPEQFVKEDPYFTNKLVSEFEIRELEMASKKEIKDLAVYYKYR